MRHWMFLFAFRFDLVWTSADGFRSVSFMTFCMHNFRGVENIDLGILSCRESVFATKANSRAIESNRGKLHKKSE